MYNKIYWQQWFYNFGLNCDSCKYKKHSLPNDEFCFLCKGKGYNPPPHIHAYSKNFKTQEKAKLWGPCYQCCSNIEGFCKADYCLAQDSCKVFEPIIIHGKNILLCMKAERKDEREANKTT